MKARTGKGSGNGSFPEREIIETHGFYYLPEREIIETVGFYERA